MRSNLMVVVICCSVVVMAASGCKKQSGTVENLKAAITGETTASAKYAAYAKKAKEEKFDKIAELFEAASRAESIHARKHTSVLLNMGEKMDPITPRFAVQSTRENILDAIKGESYEVSTMYPDFIKKAREEGKDDAAGSFDYAFQVEKVHHGLYQAALAALDRNDFTGLADSYAVCPVCGNTVAGIAPANCEICGVPGAEFIILK